MPLSILTNIASIRAQRRLGQASDQLQRTFERLSSGQRINHASDDPAGLSLAGQLNAQVRLSSTAIRNTNDGISYISIGDGALGEIGNILTRMAELAEQAANGPYTTQQRSPLNHEFTLLGQEIERIAATTKFNDLAILSGGANVVLQVGLDSQATSQITITGIQATLQSISLAPTNSSTLTYSLNAATVSEAQYAARTALDAVMAAINEVSIRRGTLGAAESRLSTTISNLSSTREALQTAASRITDVDVAEETANLVRLKILQQATTAVLAQANVEPTLALRLLKNP